MTNKKYKPFSTGTQYADWTSRNCDTCKKGFNEKKSEYRCDYEFKLALAYVGNGYVSKEIAHVIGYLDNKNCYIWECPEWQRGRKS